MPLYRIEADFTVGVTLIPVTAELKYDDGLLLNGAHFPNVGDMLNLQIEVKNITEKTLQMQSKTLFTYPDKKQYGPNESSVQVFPLAPLGTKVINHTAGLTQNGAYKVIVDIDPI